MIAIISDLHSNLEAVSTALRDIEKRRIETVYCLGDVIGYGANPREVLAMIMERCRVVILGNHEYALMYTMEDFNDKARAAIEWTRGVLNAADRPREENYRFWGWLGDLPQTHRDEDALFVHGSPRNPILEYMLPRDAKNPVKMKSVFERQDRPVCFTGHSHIPGVYTEAEEFEYLAPDAVSGAYKLPKNRKTLINVGSVGQPRDGDTRLSYASYDGETVYFHRLEYDYKKASEKIRSIPELPNYLADRLLVGR